MLKLLIAARPGALADLLTKVLSAQFIVHTCSTATDVRRLMETVQPDVLVIQSRLEKQNGLSVLHNCNHRPRATLILTDFINEEILRSAEDAGVDALIMIPCSIKYVTETIDRILEKVPSPET